MSSRSSLCLSLRKLVPPLLSTVCLLLLAGCEYEIPLTETPTRAADERLVGDWVEMNGWMKVRLWDANHLVLFHNGNLYRAYHSDCGGTAFVSLQGLESPDRRYAYAAYTLSEDGTCLRVKLVSESLVPKDINDIPTMQKTVQDNAQNPKLFGNEFVFTRLH